MISEIGNLDRDASFVPVNSHNLVTLEMTSPAYASSGVDNIVRGASAVRIVVEIDFEVVCGVDPNRIQWPYLFAGLRTGFQVEIIRVQLNTLTFRFRVLVKKSGGGGRHSQSKEHSRKFEAHRGR